MIRWSPAQPPRPGCPHRRLRRLLARELPHGWIPGTSTLRPWASANFVGARHIFPCSIGGDDTAALCHALQVWLNGVEWRLTGHIVADIVVEPADGHARIEILTVED